METALNKRLLEPKEMDLKFGTNAWTAGTIGRTVATAVKGPETLEELDIENKNIFLAAGGQRYHYIPALNDRPEHIRALANLVVKLTQGWPETEPGYNTSQTATALADSRQRALEKGAGQ